MKKIFVSYTSQFCKLTTGFCIIFLGALNFSPSEIAQIGFFTLLGTIIFVFSDFGVSVRILTLTNLSTNNDEYVNFLILKIFTLFFCLSLCFALMYFFEYKWEVFFLAVSGYLASDVEFFSNSLKLKGLFLLEAITSFSLNLIACFLIYIFLENNASFLEFCIMLAIIRFLIWFVLFFMVFINFRLFARKVFYGYSRLKSELSELKAYYFDSITMSLSNNLDMFIVKFFLSTEILGLYFLGRKIFTTSLVAIQAVSGFYIPFLSRSINDGIYDITVYKTHKFFFFIGATVYSFLVTTIGIIFFENYLGQDYTEAKKISLLFGIVLVIKIISSRSGMKLLSVRAANLKFKVTLNTTILTLITGLILVNFGVYIFMMSLIIASIYQFLAYQQYEKSYIPNR